MDAEDKEWGSFAEAALLHGRGSIPAHLNTYSPDLHGTIFDTGSTQQRWLAEFGVSAGSSAHNLDGADALGAQHTRSGIPTSAKELDGSLTARTSSASGKPSGTAASQHTQQQQQQQSNVWARADQPSSGTADQQAHAHHLQEVAVLSEPTLQQRQHGSTSAANMQQQSQQQQAAACTQQQQQQQKIQLQAFAVVQQQQPLGTSQQQLWGLQQQLWGLQQQAALIAHQQQQIQQGGQVLNVLPQMTLPMAHPLHLPLNVAGLSAPGAAAFTPCTLQHHSVPGLPNMGVAHAGLAGGAVLSSSLVCSPSLSGAVAAAASLAGASAAASNKRQRAVGRHGSKASDMLPVAAGAAAVVATAAATHPHLMLGKATTVVKKQQRERHRSVVSTLEAELAEKLAHLQMLSAENEMLKLRAAVLEATVQSREDQMRVISEHGPPVYPIDAPSPAPRSLPSTTATASSSATGDSESPTASAAAAVGSTAISGTSHSKSVNKLPVDLQSSGSTAAGDLARVSASVAAGQDDEAAATWAAAGAAAALAAGQEPPAHLAELQDFQRDANGTRETIKQMCVDDIIRHWKQFLQDVTGELVHVQKEESLAAFKQQTSRLPGSCAATMSAAWLPNDVVAAMLQQQQQPPALSPSHQRINQLVAKYSFLIKTAQQLNPSAYCRLFGTHLDTGLPAPYSDAHWRRVVKVLDLTKYQVNHILACAELYFSCRAKLQNEQRALQQQLKHTFASTEGLLLASMTDDSPMKPWLDQLANNLKREHVLRVMLNSFVWGKIFTPVQCAKAAVYSHPWYIDVHAIVCVMCEDALTTPAANGQRPLVFPHRLQPGPTQQTVT